MSEALRAGYKLTEVGVIPENWEVKAFTEVTDLITCGIAATPVYVSESQGYPFLSSTNVKNGQLVWSGYKHISAELHRLLYKNNPPQRGDVLYSRVGTIGEAAVVEVDFQFSWRCSKEGNQAFVQSLVLSTIAISSSDDFTSEIQAS